MLFTVNILYHIIYEYLAKIIRGKVTYLDNIMPCEQCEQCEHEKNIMFGRWGGGGGGRWWTSSLCY